MMAASAVHPKVEIAVFDRIDNLIELLLCNG
jgi:hypothetical protein